MKILERSDKDKIIFIAIEKYRYNCANYPLASPHSFKPDEVEVFYEIAPPGTFLIPFSLSTLFIRSCLNRTGVLMGITVITPERRKI